MVQTAQEFRDSIFGYLIKGSFAPLQTDNFDADRFNHNGEDNALKVDTASLVGYLSYFADTYPRLFATYEKLADPTSKAIFAELLIYRIMGHLKVKMSSNTAKHWEARQDIKSYVKGPSTIAGNSAFGNLEELVIPFRNDMITVNGPSLAMAWAFLLGQYFYDRDGLKIQPEPGDVVIDCGACFGDTALVFASAVGEKGHVFAFEFMPTNLEVAEHNFAANPKLKPRITMIPKGVSDHVNDVTMLIDDKGTIAPAARIEHPQIRGRVPTTTLDTLVAEGVIPRVNFIKMDVEGHEMNVLRGAVESIKKFKPKLALSLYHKPQDYFEIPEFITNLDLGYEFHLDHYTIHSEETVLYAIAK